MNGPGPVAPPRVSVIVIFLNPGVLIGEAIGSVLVQSFGDWELILVDDGSSDGSSATARQAAAADTDTDRVRYIDHPGHANLGTSASRDLGLHAARGEFVLYLDADDLLFIRALERLVGAAEADPALAAVFATTLWWNWAPEFAGREDGVQSYGRRVGRPPPPRLLQAMIFDETLHPANCSSLIRRQALLEVGGFEAEFSGMYEDTVLLAKLLLHHLVFVTDRCVSAYRMHPASQCHRAADEGSYHRDRPNIDRGRYLRWLRRHLRALGQRDLGLKAVLARELWAYDRPRLFRLVNSYKVRAILRALHRLVRPGRSDAPSDSEVRLEQAQADLRDVLSAIARKTVPKK